MFKNIYPYFRMFTNAENQNATRPPTNNATNLASTTEEPITTTTTIEQINMTTEHVYTSAEPALVATEPDLRTIDDVTTNRPTTTGTVIYTFDSI